MADELNLKNDKSAFTVRRPSFTLLHLVAFGSMIALSLFISVYYVTGSTRNLIILVLSAIMVAFVHLVQNRNFEERTATEFQCLVFSGAMRSNTILNAIVYSDGSIFYLDPRYAMNFDKASANHNLDQFLTTIGIDNDQKIAVYDAIRDSKKRELDFIFKTEKDAIPLKISIAPLQRPEGFISIAVMK